MARPDFTEIKNVTNEMIRVNHAGEYGAKRIYEGQLKYLKNPNDVKLIKDMLNHELVHLDYFSNELLKRHIRPTSLMLFWHKFGYFLGNVSGFFGSRTAMLVTQSVEEVIEQHYQKQIEYLLDKNTDRALLENIQKFQLEEISHKDIAIMHESKMVPFAPLLSGIIKLICKISIGLSQKI